LLANYVWYFLQKWEFLRGSEKGKSSNFTLIHYVRKKVSFVCIFWQVFVDIFLENYIIHASKERLLE
jgi:hypothetical protein